MQDAHTLLVSYKRDALSVVRQVKSFHIPWNVRGQELRLFGRQIQKRKPLKFRILVRRNINSLTILAEGRLTPKSFLFRISRRDRRLFTARGIYQPQLGLVDA